MLSLFFLGRGIGVVTQGTIPTAAKLLEQSDNWGLGFGAEGAQPTGNVSASELAQYGAWYVGDAKEKVIYLTFDAGYENGNTCSIRIDGTEYAKNMRGINIVVYNHVTKTVVDSVCFDTHTKGAKAQR